MRHHENLYELAMPGFALAQCDSLPAVTGLKQPLKTAASVLPSRS